MTETQKNNLLMCKYADELGIELTGGYYPRVEYGYLVVNRQIKAGKKLSFDKLYYKTRAERN